GPRTYIVGLPDASVRESHQRVRAALSASRLPHPRGDCLINLAPADLRKEGPVYDLPIAVALLRMQGVIGEAADAMLDHFAIAGELSLDGTDSSMASWTSGASARRRSVRHPSAQRSTLRMSAARRRPSARLDSQPRVGTTRC
ncbi:MAG: hypothetical protein RL354_2245, partial [Planctomycetota bacterium]